MLFLFWCSLRLACLFSCSHLTLFCLERSNSAAALLLVLLPVVIPHIIGPTSSGAPSPLSPPSWLLLWCSFLLNCGWHLPSYFSANCPYAVDLRLASLRFLVSGLSERLAWAPLVLLLEQLVPIWDREDAANEVKQLAPVWSSKHTHGTVKQRERERVWLEQNKRYSAWRGGRDTPNEIRKEWGK